MAYLKIIDPQGTVSYVTLDTASGVTNIGRHPDNDLVLNAPQIKPFHAIIDHRRIPFTLIILADNTTPAQPIHYNQPIFIAHYNFTLLHENQISEQHSITLKLKQATDQTRTLWFWQKTTSIEVRLTNPTPQTIPIHLSALDQRAMCQFALQPPSSPNAPTSNEVTFTLLPYQQVTIPIKITAPSSAWVALHKPTYPYNITASQPHVDTITTLQATLQQRPLIGPGLLISGLGLLVMVIVMLMIWFYPREEYPQIVYQPTATVSPLVTPKADWKVVPTDTPVPTAEPLSYTEIFQAVGTEYNLDWRILAATAYVESRFDQYAVGRDGDTGLMQIIPTTWREWAPKVGVSNPYDPSSNIQVGAAYMSYLRGYCASKGYPGVRWMLVAYNWGPQNINRFAQRGGRWEDLPDKQRNYALKIIQATQYVQWQIPQPEEP